MYRTSDLRKLQARARTEYGRLLELEDDIRAVLGNTQGMAARAQRAAHEVYSLMNALNLRAIEYRDPRGRYRSEATVTQE